MSLCTLKTASTLDAKKSVNSVTSVNLAEKMDYFIYGCIKVCNFLMIPRHG